MTNPIEKGARLEPSIEEQKRESAGRWIREEARKEKQTREAAQERRKQEEKQKEEDLLRAEEERAGLMKIMKPEKWERESQ